jgi:hypothetical protein
MKRLIILFNLVVFVALPAIAGNGGRGAGDLSRLLLKSKKESLPQIIDQVAEDDPVFDYAPKLREKYAAVRAKMTTDLQGLDLNVTKDKLEDRLNHYQSWISLSDDNKTVHYNPQAYMELVRVVPQQALIDETLLHELGHLYGMGEDESWSFARLLMHASQRPAEVTGQDPTRITVKLVELRRQIESILNSKFQILTREKIAEITGSISGSSHGTMTNTAPFATSAVQGLLGAALGGGAGAGLGALASLPFAFVASPGLLVPAVVGAGLGTFIGAMHGANNPAVTGQGTFEGSIQGSIQGSQWQTFSAPTLYTTAVVDTAPFLPLWQAMYKYPKIKASDCTFTAVNILGKISQSRNSLSPTGLSSLSNLIAEYNSNLDALRMLAAKYVMHPQIGAQIGAEVDRQEKWSQPKRIIIASLNFSPRDFVGKCNPDVESAWHAINSRSVSFETFLINFERNEIPARQE